MNNEDFAEHLTTLMLIGTGEDKLQLINTIRSNPTYIDGAIEFVRSPQIKTQLLGFKHLALKTDFKSDGRS